MKERAITDQKGNSWTLVQAYSAGEGDNSEKVVKLTSGQNIPVVATPNGGAKSIRLLLPQNWEEALSDEELMEALQKAKEQEGIE